MSMGARLAISQYSRLCIEMVRYSSTWGTASSRWASTWLATPGLPSVHALTLWEWAGQVEPGECMSLRAWTFLCMRWDAAK